MWLTAAAVLQGIALGLTGVVIATSLDASSDAIVWMLGLAMAMVAYLLVQWHAQMLAFRIDSAEALHLRLGEYLGRLPLGWFTPTRQAELIDLATAGIPQSMSFPSILLRPALTAIVTPVASALTLLLLDWRYALAVSLAIAVAWAVSRVSGQLAKDVDERRHRVGAQATRRVLEYAALQPVIRTDQRPADGDALECALANVRDDSRRSSGTVIPGLLAFGLTLNILFAVMIGCGVIWLTAGNLSTPVFLGIIVVIARLTSIASAGAELTAGLRMQRGILERLSAVFDTPPLPVHPQQAGNEPLRSESSNGTAALSNGVLLQARNLSFTYDRENGTSVLDDVSFELPKRGLTAVVGPSGSGKTTLLRLLARFWDPTSGSILLGGSDLRELTAAELASQLATVLQDDYLLDASIRANILLGRPNATNTQLANSVDATGLRSFIDSVPGGLDAPVGPGGSKLSGGQRQRVCVARALLKNAPLTIMDEATSAVDPANARIISTAAQELALHRSVLLIAHNLDTVIHADQIIVLDQGQIVERGDYQGLVAARGMFHTLLQEHGSSLNRTKFRDN
ncbi:MAG: ABC transporter ATP-binding protein [Gulosibacter sp.]|uniref:ABC transporter ATP-binding protein n=1 Tax=Gulosibacter sp. TaxID=2817531 RepID=UPI003F921612